MPKHATLDGTGKVPAEQLPSGMTLPDQAGNNGKYLKTNGTSTLWDTPAAGSATWGGITGTLSSQTDLQSALDGKSATSHNHTGVYQPVATVLTNTTASFTTAQEAKLNSITGTNTGDQTSIVGITGTKAQFNAAVSDGDIQFVGDAPTAHTHLLAAGATDVTITAANLNALDDGVNTALHFHDADRARANHTGTQAWSTLTGTPTTLSGYGISDAASSTHVHGNVTNSGAIGSTANLPIITGTSGVLQAGAFGTGANTFCQGNDSRLSDDRTANGIRTATTVVSVSAAAAPTSGQVLTATSGTVATWQTPAGGAGVSGVSAVLTATQANSTTTPATLTNHTFTLPAGKTLLLNGQLIATAAATTTGLVYGVKVTNPTGANGNVQGSMTSYVNIASTAVATGLMDGDIFNVAANANATITVIGSASTAGNNAAQLQCVIKNQSTVTSATIEVVFASEVATSAVTAQIGTGAAGLIF